MEFPLKGSEKPVSLDTLLPVDQPVSLYTLPVDQPVSLDTPLPVDQPASLDILPVLDSMPSDKSTPTQVKEAEKIQNISDILICQTAGQRRRPEYIQTDISTDYVLNDVYGGVLVWFKKGIIPRDKLETLLETTKKLPIPKAKSTCRSKNTKALYAGSW